MNGLWRNLRYDLPLHFVLRLTGILPDNVVFLRLRGWLARPFFKSCGKNLRLARGITFYNPTQITLGADVYIGYGCYIIADAEIKIDDQVLFGPYVVVASSNHTRKDRSYRYGAHTAAPIYVGRGSWVGAHVTLMSGASIGQGCLVASHAAVAAGDYADDAFIAGVPARVKSTVSDYQANDESVASVHG